MSDWIHFPFENRNGKVLISSRFQAWAPVMETSHDGMITESMYQSVKNGKLNKCPLLTGINSEEELGHIASEYRIRNAGIKYFVFVSYYVMNNISLGERII